MTLQQLRYAVEVEKTGSITKSAANLFLSQPNLSTALKSLEEEIGITVFSRSSKGVEITREGADFLSYAKSIIAQMDNLEFIFKNPQKQAVSLVIACVRSSYASRVFCDFYNMLPKETATQLRLLETTPNGVFDAVVNSKADIGRTGFLEADYPQVRRMMAKNRIIMDLLWKVRAYVLVSARSPLAQMDTLNRDTLAPYTQVIYSDMEESARFDGDVPEPHPTCRKIYVEERGTMMDLLANCHDCYLWTTSTHPDILRMYNLVARPFEGGRSIIEAIIYQKDRPRSKEMQWMIEQFRSLKYAESFLYQEAFQPQTIL